VSINRWTRILLPTNPSGKVTSPAAYDSPPPKAPRKRKREPPQQKAEIAFGRADGEGPNTFTIWQGLHGVCRELWEIQGRVDHDIVNRYANLSAAAVVLSELMEDRLMLGL